MTTRLVNRNVATLQRRTSIRLEPELWSALREICDRERLSLSGLVQQLESRRDAGGRTSAVRVHVLDYFRAAATEEGHCAAGHGALPSAAATGNI
jgi:predicted DNA-binding ribbon-helix-helix protein